MKRALAVAIVGAIAMTLSVAAASAAAPKAPVVKNGACSGASTWRLTVNMDAGRIEADSEIQTHAAGQVWKSRFSDNGKIFGRARKTTQADGSTSATRLAHNRAGLDTITVRSVNVTTGEVCTASATF